MSSPGPADLAVVVPTRDRWPVLARTLAALGAQSVGGFETVVVVDGTDQRPPALPGCRVVQVDHGGPGAARNAGVEATDRPLVLFLGDDMVPDPGLVAAHLNAHRDRPAASTAVLGHVDWHPEVAAGGPERWLEWSHTQFDFPPTATGDAGFGRFYSCNVSLGRRLFREAGGFDPSFRYYYEDLDLGYRLDRAGMRLAYEPAARARHLHPYDLTSLRRRFRGVAEGEYHMAERHRWFEPFFLARVRQARRARPAAAFWPVVVDRVPDRARRLQRLARRRADDWYLQQVAEDFAAGWAAARDLAELQAYLGPRYDHAALVRHRQAVDDERHAAKDEETFYRTAQSYLYDLTAFAMSGTKAPYLSELRAVVPPGSSVLDFGCGIGADGLRLADDGYRVAFADYANPSTAFLRWRLERRRLDAPVYDLDHDQVPAGFDAAFSFDVIEHVDDPFAFLDALERRAAVVVVNLLEDEPGDTDLHRPLPIGAILDHAADRGLVRYRRYHGRSHLVVYRSGAPSRAPAAERVRSRAERLLGARLPGRPGWHPLPAP